MSRKHKKQTATGWNPVADWYDGWVGKDGSHHHQKLAIPALLDLLDPQPEENILDFGAGQGVLAPHIVGRQACYTGVDVSRRLITIARQRHGNQGHFYVGDVRKLKQLPPIRGSTYDAVTCLLSIQDMNPLDQVFASAAWALKSQGRIVILMTHPCFRIPRQSGWGFDEGRKLRYRRLDSYLSRLNVPMKAYGSERGTTISFHRPLSDYINALAAHGFQVNQMREITGLDPQAPKTDRRALQEFPVFMVLRAQRGS